MKLSRTVSAIPLTFLFAGPVLASLALMAPIFGDIASFQNLFTHPQFWGGLRLSLITGISSSILSLAFAVLVVASVERPDRFIGACLAVPHLAFAIGLGFLLVPSGILARIIATLFTGWTSPPSWITTQDPAGLSLIAALVLKETPFLIWALASQLQRADLRQQFAGQTKVARSLGHAMPSVWLNVLLPQLLPRIMWPLIAVLAYGTTVVDMALVIGPTQPPTMATIIWTDINDGDPLHNARGAAGVVVLSAMNVCLLLVVWLFLRLRKALTGVLSCKLPPQLKFLFYAGRALKWLLGAFYTWVLASLLVLSFAGPWPFPKLLPDALSATAWSHLALSPLLTSLALAIATTATALAAAIAWLEGQPKNRDSFLFVACGLVLCVPPLIIALGQYRLFLLADISGTVPALFLAHLVPVTAYVFVMLQGPYRAYDSRWFSVSAGLLKSRRQFLLSIKWPMLKSPIFVAASVGFSVSMVQYIPAQLAAAGRYSTLPMEAVTFSSGGNRSLTAAYALALTAFPLIIFFAASWCARPRWTSTNA